MLKVAKKPEPPNNPFFKLLELGFERPPPSPPQKPVQRKPMPTDGAKATAMPNTNNRVGKQKKEKKAKKGGSAPGFKTSLPNARNLTAAGMKKPPPYQDNKSTKKAKPETPKTGASAQKSSRKPAPTPLVIRIDPLIESLPRRTMQELQGQWLNCIRLLEDPNKGKRQAARTFRDAILAEWERRCKMALSDPDYFDWPSTQAGPADRSQRFDSWNQEGVLKYMGYEVGKTKGLADHSRREILDAVFSAMLPPVNSPDYVKKWGLPGTAPRLARLANELARFARNGKRNRMADYSAAVADWEIDLKHLHRKYYIGKFNFGWPHLA